MKIAVVILNFNGITNTLECLKSLRQQNAASYKTQIIIVDNNSSDDSVKVLSKIKQIHFIKNKKNLGYAGGNNVGIKYALKNKADLIILINNDTIAHPNLVSTLAIASKYADIISPKIYFAKGYEFHKKRYSQKDLGRVIWYAGGKIDWGNILGEHIGVDEVDRRQYEKREKIDFATGACIAVKRNVFEKIGFFDERYFLYLEDMDFCVRAKIAGFEIIYEPQSIVWHKNAASVEGSGSKIQDYFITRNRLLFAFKFAKLKTKIAVFKQVLKHNDPIKREALKDFLLRNFGDGGILKHK